MFEATRSMRRRRSCKRGWTQNLQTALFLCCCQNAGEVDGTIDDVAERRFTRRVKKGLACAGRLQAQQSGLGARHEGMRYATQCDGKSTWRDAMFLAIGVDDDLALQYIERLVRVGVRVEGCHLALRHVVFKKQERTVRLVGGGFPRVEAATEKPTFVTRAAVSNDHPVWGCH
jgi:hypothetical protein